MLTEAYLRKWEIIAYGLVIETHRADRCSPTDPDSSFAVLELQGVWQGAPSNPLRVYDSDCIHGYQFEHGQSYLVFASRAHSRVEASGCRPMCRESECLPQLKVLGDPPTRLD